MKETVQVAVCLLDTVPVNSINEKKKATVKLHCYICQYIEEQERIKR
jgi:hypothetical protein